MARRIKIELIETLKETVAKAIQQASSLEKCKYVDIRLGIHETKHAHAENGRAKGMGEDFSVSFETRVLAGEMSAWGFYGQPIGEVESNPKRFSKILTQGINRAYARAIANANKKAEGTI